jgi:hypothetical protein
MMNLLHLVVGVSIIMALIFGIGALAALIKPKWVFGEWSDGWRSDALDLAADLSLAGGIILISTCLAIAVGGMIYGMVTGR